MIHYPQKHPLVRRSLARNGICSECGGRLDIEFVCTRCAYDARDEGEMLPQVRKIFEKYSEEAMDKRWKAKGGLGTLR